MRDRALVPTLGLMTALLALVGSLGAPLIVVVARDYGVSTAAAQWTLSLPYLTGAASMPVIAWLASSRFRRPTTLVVIGLVCLGSLGGALPLGFGALLAGRALHGLGLGLMPVAISAARDALSGERRSRAIATLSVTNVIGGGIAFPVVGLLVDLGGVRLAYWSAALTTLVTLALAAWAMPGPTPGMEARRVDIVGAMLLAAGGAGLVLALTRGAADGWLSLGTLLTGLAALLALVGWVRRSLSAPHPLMDLRRARAPLPLGVFLTSFTGGAGMYMTLVLVVVLAQTPASTGWGLGLSATQSGLVMVPYAVGNVLGTRLSIRVRKVLAPANWVPLGVAVYTLSAVLLVAEHEHAAQVFVVMAVAGVGSGLSFAQMPGLLVMSVPPHETGAAVGFSMVVRLIGFSIGATVAGILLSSQLSAGEPTAGAFQLAVAVNLGWWCLATVLALVVSGRERGPSLEHNFV